MQTQLFRNRLAPYSITHRYLELSSFIDFTGIPLDALRIFFVHINTSPFFVTPSPCAQSYTDEPTVFLPHVEFRMAATIRGHSQLLIRCGKKPSEWSDLYFRKHFFVITFKYNINAG